MTKDKFVSCKIDACFEIPYMVRNIRDQHKAMTECLGHIIAKCFEFNNGGQTNKMCLLIMKKIKPLSDFSRCVSQIRHMASSHSVCAQMSCQTV